jgi:hypothetical protein
MGIEMPKNGLDKSIPCDAATRLNTPGSNAGWDLARGRRRRLCAASRGFVYVAPESLEDRMDRIQLSYEARRLHLGKRNVMVKRSPQSGPFAGRSG